MVNRSDVFVSHENLRPGFAFVSLSLQSQYLNISKIPFSVFINRCKYLVELQFVKTDVEDICSWEIDSQSK